MLPIHKHVKRVLLSGMFLMPVVMLSALVSFALQLMGIQETPISSWIAIASLSVYACVKLDLQQLMIEAHEHYDV